MFARTAEIIALRVAGKSVDDIAASVGCSRTSVYRVLEANGYAQGKQKAAAQVKQSAMDLFRGGVPVSEIARRLGYTAEAVGQWLRAAGIHRRPRT